VSRSLRRGTLAATVATVALTTLAACGAGADAQSLEVRPDNAATAAGNLKLQNIAVITAAGAEGSDAGAVTEAAAGKEAAVTGRIFNNGTTAETLQAITLPGATGTVRLRPAKGTGSVTVPAGGSLLLGGTGNASAVIDGGAEGAQDGNAQPLVFRFSEQGEVTVRAFVVPAKGYYADYGPTAAPSPSPKPAETPAASESPAGVSAEAGASAESGASAEASSSASASATG
jgi:hypothetical protein